MVDGGQQATSIDTHLQTGSELFDSDPKRALAAYYQAVSLDSTHIEGWNQIGRLMFDLQQYAEAELVFARVEQLANEQGLDDWAEMASQNIELTRQTRQAQQVEQADVELDQEEPEPEPVQSVEPVQDLEPEPEPEPEFEAEPEPEFEPEPTPASTIEARSIEDIGNIASVAQAPEQAFAQVPVTVEPELAGETETAIKPEAVTGASVNQTVTDNQLSGESAKSAFIEAPEPAPIEPTPIEPVQKEIAPNVPTPVVGAPSEPAPIEAAQAAMMGQAEAAVVEDIPIASAPVEVAILEALGRSKEPQPAPVQSANPANLPQQANQPGFAPPPAAMSTPTSTMATATQPVFPQAIRPMPAAVTPDPLANPPVNPPVNSPVNPPAGPPPIPFPAHPTAPPENVQAIPPQPSMVPPTKDAEMEVAKTGSGKTALIIAGIVGAVGIGIGAAQFIGRSDGPAKPVPVIKSEAKLAAKTETKEPEMASKLVPVAPKQLTRDEAYKIGMKHLVKGEFVEAKGHLEKAEELGHAEAAYNLASLYAKGNGTDQSYEKTVSYLQKSANRGYYPAMTNLGLLYAQGQGVEQNYLTARSLWLKAAAGEHPDAMHNLAVIYATGKGVEKNMDEAIKWYRKGANAGFVDSIANLGLIYANGDGVARDYEEAKRLWEKSAAKGHADSIKNLEKLKQVMQ